MHPRLIPSRSAYPRTSSLVVAALWGALLSTPAGAAPAPSAEEVAKAQSEAYRASVAQDTLRRDAIAVEQELASIREEVSLFLPDQVKLVDRAFSKLSSLSQNEMVDAVASLRSASSAEDMAARLTALADAKEDQLEIGKNLRQMAVDLKAQQTAKALAEILTKLVRSQATSVSTVERITANPANDGAKLEQQARAAASEQEFVNSDVRLLNVDLEELSKNLPQGPQRESFIKVLTLFTQQQLVASAEGALATLKTGDLPSGLLLQRKTLDTLVAMLSALDSTNASISEQLKEKLAEVKALAQIQRDLGLSEGLEKKPATMVESQKALADRAAELAALLQPLNNKAADQVRAAKADMEEAMHSMRQKDKEDRAAAPEQALAAASKLDDTIADIEAQLATAEGPQMPDTKQELAQALQQLQSATEQAALEQKSNAQTGQPNPALQDRVEKIQEYAAAVAPEAAAKLGEAASNMNNPSPQAQQEAAQDLAQASQALQEQMADLSGKSQEQQALAAAESQVQKAQQETGEAQAAIAPVPPQKPNPAQAASDLAEAQKAAEAAAKAAQAAGAPPETKDALAKAQAAMKEAQAAAAEGKAPEAGKAAEDAQKALGEAKEGIAQAKADAAQKASAAMEAQAAQNAGQPKPGQSGEQKPGQSGEPKSSQPGQPQPGQPQNAQNQPSQDGPSQGQVSQNANGSQEDYSNSQEVTANQLKNSGGNFVPQPVASGISSTDRAAVAQLSEEKPPRDFVPTVQQYYKNLADGAGQ